MRNHTTILLEIFAGHPPGLCFLLGWPHSAVTSSLQQRCFEQSLKTSLGQPDRMGFHKAVKVPSGHRTEQSPHH